MTLQPWLTHHHQFTDYPPHSYGSRGKRSDRPALICGDTTVSWRELRERVASATAALERLGVGAGDHVGLVLPNCVEFVEIAYAASSLDACVVPIPPKSTARELKTSIEVADCSMLIVEPSAVGMVGSVASEFEFCDVVPLEGSENSYAAYRDSLKPDFNRRMTDESAAFYLALTGGTTGVPKACAVSARVQVQWWRLTSLEFDMREGDLHFLMAPLHHGLGFFFAFAQLSVGGTVVMIPEFDAESAVDVFRRHAVSTVAGVPTMYRALLQQDWRSESLRGLISGGATLTSELRESLGSHFPHVGIYDYYGASDGGIFAIRKPSDQDLSPTSVGYPPAGIELAILDDDGNEVPRGDSGLVYKRGLGLGAEYYRRPAETRRGYRGDWHTVGDLGYIDDDESLQVLGRAKDTIISGGINVFPDRIETVLRRYPGVEEAAVVGVHDEKWGQAVHAVIVASPGLDDEVLDDYLRSRLSRYERPKVLHRWDSLPHSAAGKILRRTVRDLIEGESGAS